jgi:TonB family protein
MSLKYLAQHLLLSALLLGTSAFCHAQARKPQGVPPPPPPAIEDSPNGWKEFSSTEGGFKILMPGTPSLTTQEIVSDLGMPLTVRFYQLSTTTSFFMVTYADFPFQSDEVDVVRKLLDGGRDNMLAKDKGIKLISEKEMTLDGAPGREMFVQQKDFIIRSRSFFVKGRFYQIAFGTLQSLVFKTGQLSLNPQDRTELYEATANKFLDSFKPIPSLNSELGEVDRLLLKEKGVVIGTCALSADCKSLTDDHTLTGGPLNDKAINLPQPVYPAIAKAARASGPVRVKVLVDEEGKVIAAQVVSGHPLLQSAAIKAAREARFSPTLFDGKPVKLAGVILYNFVPR